jgi:hypothetical protein
MIYICVITKALKKEKLSHSKCAMAANSPIAGTGLM